MKNWNTVFFTISRFAESKTAGGFALTWAIENYGPIIKELKLHKAAKKAFKRINTNRFRVEDIMALEAEFLYRLGIYGAKEGDTRQFEDRVYILENGRWEFDSLVNPHIHDLGQDIDGRPEKEGIMILPEISRTIGDSDGDITIPFKNGQYPFIAEDPVKFVDGFLRENARTHRT